MYANTMSICGCEKINAKNNETPPARCHQRRGWDRMQLLFIVGAAVTSAAAVGDEKNWSLSIDCRLPLG